MRLRRRVIVADGFDAWAGSGLVAGVGRSFSLPRLAGRAAVRAVTCREHDG
jgi:hypothetical protein